MKKRITEYDFPPPFTIKFMGRKIINFTIRHEQIKIYHLTAQNISIKDNQFKRLLESLGENTLIAVPETWLTDYDDKDVTKQITTKKRGGGVLLLIPQKLNPKPRADLALKKTQFESVYVECRCSDRQRSKQLVLIILINQKHCNFSHTSSSLLTRL